MAASPLMWILATRAAACSAVALPVSTQRWPTAVHSACSHPMQALHSSMQGKHVHAVCIAPSR